MKKLDFAGAAENYRQSLSLRNDLVTRAASNFTWLKNLADSNAKLADALYATGDLAGALSSTRPHWRSVS